MDPTAQAQADQTPSTVADPLDTANTPNTGTQELDAYQAEVAAFLADDTTQGDEPAEDLTEREEETDGAEEQATEEEISDGNEDEPEVKTDRFRIRAKDEVEIEALSLRKRHPDWTLKDCIAKAEQLLGVSPEVTQNEAEQAAPETVATVTARIKELREQHKQASADLELERAAELFDELEELRDKREELRITETTSKGQQQAKEQEAYDEAYRQAERITLAHYPAAADPDSPLVKRMVELDAQMRDLNDPNYHNPKKPLLLAQAAAVELGILMVKPGAPKPKPISSRSPAQPASGNRGTTPGSQGRTAEDAILNATSLEEYERLVGRG